MPSVIELFGWFVFNIAIPLFAPLMLLPLIRYSSPSPERYVGIVRFAITDGQLLWSVIAISANGCYMMASASNPAGSDAQVMWLALGLHVAVLVAASVMAAFATMDSFMRRERRRRHGQQHRRYPLTWIVVIVACAVSNFIGYVCVVRPST